MVPREDEVRSIRDKLSRFPVVGIIGARQVGKTTLTHFLTREYPHVNRFDLENPADLSKLDDPLLALENLKGLIILDEIQRKPDLFPVLRVLADRVPNPGKFLILGSASPALLKQSSESLAGRIIYHRLGGFSLRETGTDDGERLWRRGGFPKSYLAGSDEESMEWRQAFIQTFLERDIPQLGISIGSTALRRFWTMLAHYHARIWNASEFARSFGIADTTVKKYLDILTSAMVVRQLQPWIENIKKRQVKSPKVYIIDSGLLHSLLNLRDQEDLESHPKVGASWEGFILEQLIRVLRVNPEECHFWASHGGAELDLIIVRGRKRTGFEIKRTSGPKITPSMKSSLEDLKLENITVIHAGNETYPLSASIKAVSWKRLLQDLGPL